MVPKKAPASSCILSRSSRNLKTTLQIVLSSNFVQTRTPATVHFHCCSISSLILIPPTIWHGQRTSRNECDECQSCVFLFRFLAAAAAEAVGWQSENKLNFIIINWDLIKQLQNRANLYPRDEKVTLNEINYLEKGRHTVRKDPGCGKNF